MSTNIPPDLWTTLTNAVGRAAEAAPEATEALRGMLDTMERRFDVGTLTEAVAASAVAWCDLITEVGYVAAMPWLGWLPQVNPPAPPIAFPRLIPDIYPDQAALDAEIQKQIVDQAALPIPWEDTWTERWMR